MLNSRDCIHHRSSSSVERQPSQASLKIVRQLDKVPEEALNFPTFKTSKEKKVHHNSVKNLHKFVKNTDSELPRIQLVDENYAEFSPDSIGVGSRLIKKNFTVKTTKA